MFRWDSIDVIPAHPRECVDPGSQTPAFVALDSRVRGNERSMLYDMSGSER